MIHSASIYLPVIRYSLKDCLPDLQSDKGFLRKPTWYVFCTEGKTVTLSVLPGQELDRYLLGIANYVDRVAEADDPKGRKELKKQIIATRTVLNAVTDTPFTFESDVFAAFQRVTRKYNGLLFICDSVLRPNGAIACGPLGVG